MKDTRMMSLEAFFLEHERPDAAPIVLESSQPLRDLVPEPPQPSALAKSWLIDATAAPDVFEPAHTPREQLRQTRQLTMLALRRVVVNRRERSLLSQHLATLLGAGIGIAPALAALSNQPQHPRFGLLIAHLLESVEQHGRSLSAAMTPFPRAFPGPYVAMIRMGESAGRLPDALREAARLLDKDERMARRLRGALAYPLTVFAIALALGVLMLAWVLPGFAGVFAAQGQPLPAATRLLLDSGRAFQSPGFFLGVAIRSAVVCAFVRAYTTTGSGRLVVDRLLLAAPVVGPLLRTFAVARFSATLAALVRSGVRVLPAIELAGSVTGHEVFRVHSRQVARDVANGETLSACLPRSLYGSFLAELVASGEQIGAVDDACRQAADYYEAEADHAVETFSSLLEPVLVVVLGLAIAAMMLTVFVPMYRIVYTL